MYMTTFDKVAVAVVSPILALFLYLMFVMLPVEFLAEEACLEQGYPKAHVTWNLKRYCSNLDGSVTVRVDRQK